MSTDVIAENLARQIDGVRGLYFAELAGEFRGLGSWRSLDVDRWVSRAVPIVLEAERVVSDLTDAAVDAQFFSLVGDFGSSGVPLSAVTGAATRRGVPPEEVYARALKPVWSGTGRGMPVTEAVDHALSRLSSTFHLDLERASDLTAIERYANSSRVTGYRRVLTGSRHCALCILASTQVYRKRQLKPIHPNCKCRTSPIVSGDKGKPLDRALIDQVHREVSRQFGISDAAGRKIDYRKILLVREHGEYGPTLTFSKYNHTGPKGLGTPGE